MRCIFWKRKYRLRYPLAVLIFLSITMVVYLNLPDGISESSRSHRFIGSSSRPSSDVTISNSISHMLPFDGLLTVVIREFEEFENALTETVDSVEKSLGAVNVLIIADTLPYPPVNLSLSKSAHILTLSSDLSKNYSNSCPLQFLKSEYVLFIPDGVKLDSWSVIKKAYSFLSSHDGVKAVAVAVGDDNLECSALEVSLKEWTVSFQRNVTGKISSNCSYVQGAQALLMRVETLKSLAEPFAKPFPYSFYVQAALKNWKVHIMKGDRFRMFHDFFQDFHSRWKHKRAESERLLEFYKKVGIKREILKSGMSNYFGCSKNAARCFGTVVKDMPQYLYEGRWTPPCCLKALRESVSHVFGILDKCKARYWLEGGSLLGAARHRDIIPWDYDVDIGIYQDDLDKCQHLQQAKLEPYMDDDGYVWEKASEGEFYRVQYSETNHLHVDIFPFYSKQGVMTKNTWFATHPQDTEFPESFLIPLTRIKFAGIEASAPNNVRKFLEYKFGKNVIESPKYPNLQSPVL